MLLLYTDGSVLRNPGGVGGWAFLYKLHGEIVTGAGGLRVATNNTAELTAVLKGLHSLELDGCAHLPVCIVSDSQYVIYGASRYIYVWKKCGWRTAEGKPVANRQLWEELDKRAKLFATRWRWVRGHSGNPSNEECDKLAGEAARLTARSVCFVPKS